MVWWSTVRARRSRGVIVDSGRDALPLLQRGRPCRRPAARTGYLVRLPKEPAPVPSLFAQAAGREPLAARMRPRTLDEYIGQTHILGPGRLLRRAIEADRVSSLLLYGPPGTGKTTLARVIANTTAAHFTALNAVLSGVKDIREAVSEAKKRRDTLGRRTILFVDEVHRFNKAQQDALLPWVENGTVVLIGATTENPYFEVNKALVSRSRVFQLRPLEAPELRAVMDQALADAARGLGDRAVRVEEEAAEHLVNVANGDARALLNALELAVETTPPGPDGAIHVDLEVAEESIQRRAVLYDKEGDAHFDTISAFIKSLRGSDPDAALFWMARMVYAGEDPRFIFRRMLIFASEDVGLADPQALVVVEAAATTFDRIGLPEGRFPLAQAALYLANCEKSNSTMGFFDALNAVAKLREEDVPVHLKDGSRDKESLGHGEGYLYPHAYRDHWVAQAYLPQALQDRVFYQPSDQGWEGEVGPRVQRRREAQLEAMLSAPSPVERLTAGPDDPELERWVQRTASRVGERLGALRDALLEAAELQRHHVVLDLFAGTGLLTWEALRRVPEGGVWSWVARGDEALALQGLAQRLPELKRPRVGAGPLSELEAQATQAGQRFERVLGRGALVGQEDPEASLRVILRLLQPGGRAALAEPLVRRTQRLSALLPAGAGDPGLISAWAQAEDAVYHDPADPLTRHSVQALTAMVSATGAEVQAEVLSGTHALQVTPAVLDRWFSRQEGRYGARLAQHLDADRMAAVEELARRTLGGQAVGWRSESLLLRFEGA
ncbi:MAG: AAA family ATPase [Alphaproteobacteria bacterium]|nr:AAA family ATPase [Alphaproteobacteria bacterium]MCB9794560.1 AAA family ATPase [Alphaproteobacteria bacterium]